MPSTLPLNSRLGAGLSLKPEHFTDALACSAQGLWFEVHPENYMVGGIRRAWLERVAEQHPLSLHGVSLSLAAGSPPGLTQLHRLRSLIDAVKPVLVSEHLAWSTWRGHYYPDLLPCPRSGEALLRITDNIKRMQDVLGRRIAVENPSHYLQMKEHAFDEPDFLSELCERSGCGLLLDINNVYLSSHNLNQDTEAYLRNFPVAAIMEIHLAGHSLDDQSNLLIDSHDAEVSDPVWSLYRRLIERIGTRPTLIERDDRLPAFDQLMTERSQAQAVLDALGETP
ncbi:MNIO family bufferin maturase [Pseudomonas sp. KNUC1026]|uniref:MNIO family bufferin maturase n=1 Tax=Pseudomonas sp. KNUC1026 TaxID=2893890 RepID=UPI001F3BDCD3|nr:DUF692 domain-containing protein [Pseudomonas sp. KNUC1026]UFH51194.1 DUF692 domain-containing protein [Pseudomonas sp. KNUC1026]